VQNYQQDGDFCSTLIRKTVIMNDAKFIVTGPDGKASRTSKTQETKSAYGTSKSQDSNRRADPRSTARSGSVGKQANSQRGGGSGVARGAYEPVRLLGPRRAAPVEPRIPDDVELKDLDRAVLAQLRSLSKANAEGVAKHLIMVARLLDEDPEAAYAHGMAAQRRAGRIAVVREAVGVAAYRTGRWAESLSELRAARRMSGSSHQLPLMADAERGMGRPERALELAASSAVAELNETEKVELAIVASGARLDLNQAQAAVIALQIPQLKSEVTAEYTPRLRYAYAAALEAAGRDSEAAHWYSLAAQADVLGQTDADEQSARLMGLEFTVEDDEGHELAAGESDAAGGALPPQVRTDD
jgi:hypothetical protein